MASDATLQAGAVPPPASRTPAVERVAEGRAIPFSSIEEYYKRPGGTLMYKLFGADPFDFWIGRFYVGTFGILSLIGIIFGTTFYLYQAVVVERAYNLLQARLDPPPISAGLRLLTPSEPGFFWQATVFFATLAFIGWMLRQVDISRKLGMSYEIPIAYGAVVSSWITLQWLRPIAMGAWGNGFALGITHHLDWVSNIGYQYYNFFYNPFHAIGVTLLFASTLFLAMHGSAILSAANRPDVTEDSVDAFWRNLMGYSVGELGIHRAAFWVGAASVLFSNLCIYLSGTLVHDWSGFWDFWDRMPIWQSTTVLAIGLGSVIVWRGRQGSAPDPDELEYGSSGLEGTILQRPINIGVMERLFGVGQVGPIYLGTWGVISIAAGVASAFIILLDYLYQVGYNPILFVREFFVLQISPPAMQYGLGFAPWFEGGGWLVATLFLHVSVLAWFARVWSRSKAAGLGRQLAYGFAAALFLYFVIYLIRPVLMGNWAQAPAHGFKAILDWTNNVSVHMGNFYYNPFHMLSIFFLLGSTLLLAMHGATIIATARYGSHQEVEEMMVEDTGTQRAQLFWRWTMGFNANSKTIHDWCWWFAALTAITGGIGLLLSGTAVWDWFVWAVNARIVAPLP
ncbi:MAG: photosynthetic reaction center subunit M [Anaerolineales bacterium]|nr:photosynthetic reaction center subunit M [Anaerolineales bacterium]MCB9127092.1 photosynthetic reaction center subunit M [Ardenticatenales bacterium]